MRARIALLLALLLMPAAAAARPHTSAGVGVSIEASHPGPAVPRDFLGLSFEAKDLPQLATYGVTGNLVTLLRSLGPGWLRFGGVTADTQAAWAPPPAVLPSWATTPIGPADLAGIGTLAGRAGWRVLLTLGFGHYDPNAAAAEAASAQAALGPALAAVAIGNEPDGIATKNLREQPWDFDAYQPQIDAYRAPIDAAAPGLPFAGPDVSSRADANADWLAPEASREHPALLTAHLYALGCNDRIRPTIERLLSDDVRRTESRRLHRAAVTSERTGIPLRIDETNNISCGGLPGISDTFTSALWALELMGMAMSDGVAGVNFHDTLHQAGGYSPIVAATPQDLAAGQLTPKPEWYALLLARRLLGDRPIRANVTPGHPDIVARALLRRHGGLALVLENLDPVSSHTQSVRLRLSRYWVGGTILRLRAAGLSATGDVTLGGRAVASGGRWRAPRRLPRLAGTPGHLELRLPPASAALVELRRR